MSIRKTIVQIAAQEDLNFLVTNRIPRRALTQVVGRLSRVTNPLVRETSIALFRFFSKPDLSEAARDHFDSLKDCFTRELRPGARPINADPQILVSPCDAQVGHCGTIQGTTLIQAKGFEYTLLDLLADPELVELYRNGTYVTLRLTAGMYHRFHAPYDCEIDRVTYISGDTYNTNPIALDRVERLFCKNERAVIRTHLATATAPCITLVPVASILVASIRLHFLDVLLHLKHKGPNRIDCQARATRGEELGWFELGSTIIVFAPAGFSVCDGIEKGTLLKMGNPLLRLPE